MISHKYSKILILEILLHLLKQNNYTSLNDLKYMSGGGQSLHVNEIDKWNVISFNSKHLHQSSHPQAVIESKQFSLFEP